MAIKTYTEQLESTQLAIEEILQYGQSNKGPDGSTLMRADLSALSAREKQLRPLVNQEIKASSGRRGKRRMSYAIPVN